MTITSAWAAAAAGALLAIWGLPIRQAGYWLSWGRFLAALCLLGYFGMGALAGLLGYAIATFLHWKPTDSTWIDGIIFAAAGHAVVRANGAQFSASDANEAFSLLGLGTRWFENMLNELAQKGVSRQLNKMNEVEVARAARQLLGKILGRYSLDQAKDGALPAEDSRVAVLLTERLKDLADEPDSAKREVALYGLIEFCKEEICARYLPRS
jgi:hypothetical protein